MALSLAAATERSDEDSDGDNNFDRLMSERGKSQSGRTLVKGKKRPSTLASPGAANALAMSLQGEEKVEAKVAKKESDAYETKDTKKDKVATTATVAAAATTAAIIAKPAKKIHGDSDSSSDSGDGTDHIALKAAALEQAAQKKSEEEKDKEIEKLQNEIYQEKQLGKVQTAKKHKFECEIESTEAEIA